MLEWAIVMVKGCSIRELAEYLKLSTCTVSKALNDPGYPVSAKTRERILEAARKFEYQPNINAKRLFSKRSDVIGLITPSHRKTGTHIFEDKHLTQIISGMEEMFAERRYRLMVLFNDDEFQANREYLSVFQQHLLDGLLVWGAYSDEDFWKELTVRHYPHLFITSHPGTAERKCELLCHDYEDGSRRMVRHLLERGHRKIAWCTAEPNSSVTRMMDAGVRQAVEEAGLRPEEVLREMRGDYSLVSGEEIGQRLLADDCGVTAALCSSGRTARGLCDYLTGQGIAMPERFALGCCDSLVSRPGGITRILVDDLELGRRVGARIIELIENPELPASRQLLPVRLVQGTTT